MSNNSEWEFWRSLLHGRPLPSTQCPIGIQWLGTTEPFERGSASRRIAQSTKPARPVFLIPIHAPPQLLQSFCSLQLCETANLGSERTACLELLIHLHELGNSTCILQSNAMQEWPTIHESHLQSCKVPAASAMAAPSGGALHRRARCPLQVNGHIRTRPQKQVLDASNSEKSCVLGDNCKCVCVRVLDAMASGKCPESAMLQCRVGSLAAGVRRI